MGRLFVLHQIYVFCCLILFSSLVLSLESNTNSEIEYYISIICSIEAHNRRPISHLCIIVTNYTTTCPIGINPRPASASRALLRLSPCYRAYRRS